MRQLRVHFLLLLMSLTACHTDSLHAEKNPSVTLKPGMPAIEKPGVPPLNVVVPDAEATIEGVSMKARNERWLDTFGGVLDSFNPLSFEIRCKADASADRVVLTIWDWENRPVYQWSKATPVDVPLGLQFSERGVYLLTLDGFAKDKAVYRLVRSIGVIDGKSVPWRDSSYWLGVCAFPGRYHWKPGGRAVTPPQFEEAEAVAAEASLMGKLGVGLARLDVSMLLPEKPDAPIDWKRMDAAVEAYTSRGMKLALQVMHPPDWAIDEKYKGETKDKWRFPRREDAYRRYVREIVTRYGKHAAFVQVYNEPDQVEFWAASPKEYIKEFEWAKDEVRKVSKDMPITNGGYAFIDPARTEHYVKALRGETDLQAYHSHGNLRELIRDHEHMRRLHKEAGYEKPRFINTECGYAVWRLDQERTQAVATLQKILYSWAHGDEGMLLFCSRMTKGPGPGSRTNRDFGLLDGYFCPRFAYGAVAAFVHHFASARFARVLREDAMVHAYEFKRDGDRLISIFTLGQSKQITIRSDATSGSLLDPMGNQSDLKLPEVVRVTAGAYPQTVVLSGATKIEIAE